MQAAVYHSYGPPDVVRIDDVPTPVPRDSEILVRNHAATVGATDSAARQGSPVLRQVLLRPAPTEVSRCWVPNSPARSRRSDRESPGSPSVIRSSASPVAEFGAHAEYVCLPEDAAMAAKPADLSYAEAAALADATALSFLRDRAKLQNGQTVLINGASGSVGSAAVQLAKHYGATVTAVCSGANRDLVRELGADNVVDYTVDDFTARRPVPTTSSSTPPARVRSPAAAACSTVAAST